MPENRTVPTDADPRFFVEAVEHKGRREDALLLLDLFGCVTGYNPQMWGSSIVGYGRFGTIVKMQRSGTKRGRDFAIVPMGGLLGALCMDRLRFAIEIFGWIPEVVYSVRGVGVLKFLRIHQNVQTKSVKETCEPIGNAIGVNTIIAAVIDNLFAKLGGHFPAFTIDLGHTISVRSVID